VQVVSSAGDCGDVIYSLPALKALGGGALRLHPAPYTTARMTPAAAESLATLLREQPYVADCRFAESPEGVDLDGWRGATAPTSPARRWAWRPTRARSPG
jgi:hypothetical protein